MIHYMILQHYVGAVLLLHRQCSLRNILAPPAWKKDERTSVTSENLLLAISCGNLVKHRFVKDDVFQWIPPAMKELTFHFELPATNRFFTLVYGRRWHFPCWFSHENTRRAIQFSAPFHTVHHSCWQYPNVSILLTTRNSFLTMRSSSLWPHFFSSNISLWTRSSTIMNNQQKQGACITAYKEK